MIKAERMPSYNTEALKFESYATTPRSGIPDSCSDRHLDHDHDLETESDSGAALTPKHVKGRAGVHSAPSHFSPQVSQSLTEKLLDNSEKCLLEDSIVFESEVVDDWSEAASGWGVVVPYPKYMAQPLAAQHKTQSALKKGSIGSRATVRLVDEDFGGEHLCPSWKGNVEPLTYRYVPNNGYYRNHKPIRDVKEWPVIRKSKSEKSRMTPEMRQVQKNLKRDLENRLRGNSENNVYYRNGAVARTTDQYQELSGNPPQSFTEQSDTAQISKRLPVREQQLIKSASDLFMEKFNTRLSALEKEIQIPSGPPVSKKNIDSPSGPNHSPTHLTKKLKEVRASETMRPTIQSTKQHGNDFGNDLFTVIPMSKREMPLRPLEKLTPKQKQMEGNSSSSHERSPSPDVQSSDEDEDLMVVLSCASSQPPPIPKDPNTSGISTARSAIAMTNFDIEKMRNIPLSSDVTGKPKPFFMQKDSGAGAGKSTMRYTVTGTGGGAHASVTSAAGDGIDKKDLLPQMETKLGSMSNALPEIMGKRLSVITATHRLL